MIKRHADWPYPHGDDWKKHAIDLNRTLDEESRARILDFNTHLYSQDEIDAALDLTNKVVKADTMARAYLAADQADITDVTEVKVTLNTESYDVGADYDHVTNYRFTAPVTGYYDMTASVRWNDMVADKLYQCMIYKNGTGGTLLCTNTNYASAGTDFLSCTVSDVQLLTAADYVELFVYHDSGAATPDITGGASNTYMCIRLVAT